MTSIDQTELEVVHDDDASRYVLQRGGDTLGLIDYRRTENVLELFHTEIRPAARGQGLGAVLVRHTLDDLRARSEKVVPSCWYVREFIDQHADYADLLST